MSVLAPRRQIVTQQPQGPHPFAAAYMNAAASWHPKSQMVLTPNSGFSAVRTDGVSKIGRYVGCDSVSNTTALANVSSANVNARSFSMLMVVRVNATTGPGVMVRDKGSNILMRNNGGKYSLRINGGDFNSAAAFGLGTWLVYILNSSPSGISLTVNGVTVISGAAASSAAVGSLLDLWSDSQGGGSANMDVALFHLLRRPLSNLEIRSLSANPWQIFAPRICLFPISAEPQILYRALVLRDGMICEVTDDMLGMGLKPLVLLDDGRVKEREVVEGRALIMMGGALFTIPENGTLRI